MDIKIEKNGKINHYDRIINFLCLFFCFAHHQTYPPIIYFEIIFLMARNPFSSHLCPFVQW